MWLVECMNLMYTHTFSYCTYDSKEEAIEAIQLSLGIGWSVSDSHWILETSTDTYMLWTNYDEDKRIQLSQLSH